MAKVDFSSKKPAVVSSAFLYSNLANRISSQISPRHLQIGTTFGDEITMLFHTSGTSNIWEISVQYAATNKRLIAGLSPKDAFQLAIYYQEQIYESRIKELNDRIDSLEHYENSYGFTINNEAK